MKPACHRIGLTGGIGCGKSTAAACFAALGWRHFDSDRCIRDDILHRPAVVAAAVARWGHAVCPGGVALDRVRVAERVFGDDAERIWWEDLVIPPVLEEWRKALAGAPDANWVFEAPLLFEKNLGNWFDLVVCVVSNETLQLQRLERRGLSAPSARQRMAKQLPPATKSERADCVLLNDGSPDFLCRQVEHFVRSL